VGDVVLLVDAMNHPDWGAFPSQGDRDGFIFQWGG
jgi:hypothetical protein